MTMEPPKSEGSKPVPNMNSWARCLPIRSAPAHLAAGIREWNQFRWSSCADLRHFKMGDVEATSGDPQWNVMKCVWPLMNISLMSTLRENISHQPGIFAGQKLGDSALCGRLAHRPKESLHWGGRIRVGGSCGQNNVTIYPFGNGVYHLFMVKLGMFLLILVHWFEATFQFLLLHVPASWEIADPPI